MKSKSFSKDNPSKNQKIQTIVRNVSEDFTESLNLPPNARVNAATTKKSPRVFETKIGIFLWHQYVFCRAVGQNPMESLKIAKRKISRLISDLHDRKFVTQKHAYARIPLPVEKNPLDENGMY